MLTGANQPALATIAQLRALEDKPDAKLLSGLLTEAIAKARIATGQDSGPAFQQAFATNYADALKPLPWGIVGNRIKESKSSAQIVSADLVVGQVKQGIEPAVATSHQMSNELAWELISMRQALKVALPLKDARVRVLSALVAANDVKKPDIWMARDVTLTAADKLTPVTVAIWDSGSDLALFPQQTYTDPKRASTPPFNPHGLSFDLESRPTTGVLYPLDAQRKAEYSGMLGDLKGFSDLQQSIDSPEADALKKKFASLPADNVPTYLETLGFFSQYIHGTHVAGIVARGNPAVRMAAARLTFDYRNVPAAPTDELLKRAAASYQTYVDWFRNHGVRVVNMSWGGGPKDYEHALELNGIGKTPDERKSLARHYFEMDREGLKKALMSAPDVLFICAAGNSDSDNGFDETIPSSFVLPNLLVVGAVDQAGDEASFTSYGKNVVVDANGYQVDSTVPGGNRLQLSGTSMASPNTVNLAAKVLALDPKLTPTQVIELIRAGASTSADGRRHNIDAKATVVLLRKKA
jgi:subtilisin family serine protease